MNSMVQAASFSVILISWLWSHDRLCVFKLRACVIAWQQRLRSRGSTCAGKKKEKTRGSVFLTSSLHYLQFGSQSSFVHEAFVTRLCTWWHAALLLFTHSSWRMTLLLFCSWLRVSWEGRLLCLIILLKKVLISSSVVFKVSENLKKVKNYGKLMIIEKNSCLTVRSTEHWCIFYLSVMAAFPPLLQKYVSQC